MITLQHTSVYAMALMDKISNDRIVEKRMVRDIPWLLLPDAIRAYTGPRQISHFEVTPDGTDVSWMEFPSGETLQLLTKDTAMDIIKHHMNREKYPKCVIGEDTHIDVFDRHNYGHHAFHPLRMHLIQDVILDEILRQELIDVTGRFEDRFVVRHNQNIVLDGNQLREQVKLFEEWGLLHLVGKIYNKTGILLNQKWFEEHVHQVLLHSSNYPVDLAENTYRFMNIPEEIEGRINSLVFEADEEMRIFDLNVSELIDLWDWMYSVALKETEKEM